MSGCFIGRGSLLVSVLGTSGGFLPLSGQSEVTLDIQEDNESVFDARNGVIERIDWYVRNHRATLNAECFDINKDTLELLLKGKHTAVAAGSGPVVLPSPVVLGRAYALNPATVAASVVVTDAVAAVVPSGNYSVEEPYGLITFSNVLGFTQPFTVNANYGGYDQVALHAGKKIFVQALFKGVNKIDRSEVMAVFYRLALDVSEELIMVQKEFTGLTVRLQAVPDVTQPLDQTLGQYGRILLL